ncbi:PREDICTED: calcium uptake protein 3, mitochondrial-like isoform X2 [Priapulus caudatus]|uniref:Calcium uptake protein 3, mitochondrial-like isoform X2 n=1 Tax=Priapulus caudatus TaxID=37621 RepID=A0ABM1FBY8_PRICU|nr:PREDICTED: calcium uptake protein 3, mitochondrial-like isoform X2 [Priapulus caudatus]
MAALCCRLFSLNFRENIKIFHSTKRFSTSRWTNSRHYAIFPTLGLLSFGSAAAFYLYSQRKSLGVLFASAVCAAKKNVQQEQEAKDGKKPRKRNLREKRFLHFASIEYDGQIFMTPQDFLESITEEEPRPRIGRLALMDSDVRKMLKATPSRHRGGTNMFRSMHNNGLISYTEYLFLLCVLTKPQSGFRIAFNMFDTDGNRRVDKEEFLVLEQIFSQARRTKPEAAEEDEKSLTTDTSLLVHLFGQRGRDVLKYEDFHRFMDSLQSEVLELEFTEFSHGMLTIAEVDFAKILLRYTKVRIHEQEDYLERMKERIPEEKGITFKDFKQFCQFLNNLDDFAIAMRMYTYANHPVTQAEFKRAVLTT